MEEKRSKLKEKKKNGNDVRRTILMIVMFIDELTVECGGGFQMT